ncbi:hypothetical protein, partial [Ferrovum myxofaciens]|uniref:hypothetical protein n=1 Tax=Ferrovum myxofaciens TaxID=416213 RepID=UPI0013645608
METKRSRRIRHSRQDWQGGTRSLSGVVFREDYRYLVETSRSKAGRKRTVTNPDFSQPAKKPRHLAGVD